MTGRNREIHGEESAQRRSKGRERRYTLKHQLLRLPLLLLIPIGLYLPKLVSGAPERVEGIYSRAVYPVIARVLGFVSSLVPTSLAELLIVSTGIALVLLLLIRLLRIPFGKLLGRKKNRLRFFSALISVGILAGVLINLFYLLWGFNHYRLPIDRLLELEVRSRSTEELVSATERLAREAAELRAMVEEDERGVFSIGGRDAALKRVAQAYSSLGERNALFQNRLYPAKTVILSKTLSKLDIAGIYIPYTAEANVNAEQPDLYFLDGAAHETAHYLGFAREDEANFIAFLASRSSEDPAFRYSSVMAALHHCAGKLYTADIDSYSEIRREFYTEGMERDLADYSEYYKKYEKAPAKTISNNINDTYLKYNGQSDGVQSYGRVVDLLLAYFASVEGSVAQ